MDKAIWGVGRRFLLVLAGIVVDGLIVYVSTKYPEYKDFVVPLLISTSAKVGIAVMGITATDKAKLNAGVVNNIIDAKAGYKP